MLPRRHARTTIS